MKDNYTERDGGYREEKEADKIMIDESREWYWREGEKARETEREMGDLEK